MTAITHTTRSAYLMAFHRTIDAAWPGTTADKAELYHRDYVEVPFGTQGYEWSVTAAIELAKQYIVEHSE